MRVCELRFPSSAFPDPSPCPVQGEGKRAWRVRVRAVATSTSLSTPCVKTGFVPKLLSPKVRAQAVENLFFNSPLQPWPCLNDSSYPDRVSARVHKPRGRRGLNLLESVSLWSRFLDLQIIKPGSVFENYLVG